MSKSGVIHIAVSLPMSARQEDHDHFLVRGVAFGCLSDFREAISSESISILCSSTWICAEWTDLLERDLCRPARFTKSQIAVRARSEMLRAPPVRQNRSKTAYSSSETRTPMVRVRGSKIVTGNRSATEKLRSNRVQATFTGSGSQLSE